MARLKISMASEPSLDSESDISFGKNLFGVGESGRRLIPGANAVFSKIVSN